MVRYFQSSDVPCNRTDAAGTASVPAIAFDSPASIRSTVVLGSCESLLAKTQPAVPPPTGKEKIQ